MNKIGILGCGYGIEDISELEARLSPWLHLARKHEFSIAVTSAKFKEYQDLNINLDNSKFKKFLETYYETCLIDHIDIPDEPLSEAQARQLAMNKLKDCKWIWLLDLADEYYTKEQIELIIEYVNNSSEVWFSIPFKNYVFDGTKWIDGFCPPRIFKVKPNDSITLDSCIWDNDFTYRFKDGITLLNYKNLPNTSIPKSLINGGIKHMTWLNSNGKNKVEYQLKHFGACSYKWDSVNNCLAFDEEYFKRNGLPVPKLND